MISAAERAFYSGLHTALLISACLLLASSVVVWFTFGRADARASSASPRRTGVRVVEAAALVVVLVGAALGLEWFLGPTTQDAQASSGSDRAAITTTTRTTSSGGGAPTAGGGAAPTGRGGSSGPTIEVQPRAGLRDGQHVRVTGSGFSPGASLVALECADRGDATSSGDCDISHVAPVTADGAGRVSTTLTVRRGPFGSADRTCSATQACEVTVSAPSAGQDAQRATASFSFAGS